MIVWKETFAFKAKLTKLASTLYKLSVVPVLVSLEEQLSVLSKQSVTVQRRDT